jgi:CRISPR system Cascade subunit CasC
MTTDPTAPHVFVELHALVSHAPSNLNRDELGAPKSIVFGGTRRLRISSQCQKRSWRMADLFRDNLHAERARLGERTAQLGDVIAEKLGPSNRLSSDEQKGLDLLLESLGRAGSSEPKAKEEGEEEDVEGGPAAETAHLLYLSIDEQAVVTQFVDGQREALGELGARARGQLAAEKPAAGGGVRKAKAKPEGEDPIKRLRAQLSAYLIEAIPQSAIDIALFGRFLTRSEFREVDAAMQVAHAIGTQKAEVEFDYFTAMDDRSSRSAAAHIGEAELGAATFYKYAACDMALLARNLGPSDEEIHQALKNGGGKEKRADSHRKSARATSARAIVAVAHAMARVVPTGKKNSTAAQNPADYLEIVVRTDAPVSLANAFLRPVRAEGDLDVMDVSIRRLREHATLYERMYASKTSRFVLSSRSGYALPDGAAAYESLPELGRALEVLLLKDLP